MSKVKVLKNYVKYYVYANLALSIPVYIYFMFELKKMGLY